MPRAIRIHEHGGPEVLRLEEVDVPAPAPGEARVRQAAMGVNFLDTYFRSGFYPVAALPTGLGSEAAGMVEAVGADVTWLRPGDRVAYAGGAPGAYAEVRNVAADRLVPLPDDVDFTTAAGMLLRGMTAEYLLRRTFVVQPGQSILVHAAAGGVGLMLCQWAKALGARVLGTVGSDDKAVLARDHGCDEPIVYTREDFVARVRELTGGAGVPVVYDSVGRDTFLQSLDCLAPRGLMVSFGQSSGPVAPLDPVLLSRKGSLYLTRPTLFTYTATRADLLASASALFDMVRSGAVRVRVGGTYPLAQAAEAHRDLEGRRTTGSVILVDS